MGFTQAWAFTQHSTVYLFSFNRQFQGLTAPSDTCFLCTPQKQQQTATVNIFLTVPNVSDVLESHTNWYRQYCQSLEPLYDGTEFGEGALWVEDADEVSCHLCLCILGFECLYVFNVGHIIYRLCYTSSHLKWISKMGFYKYLEQNNQFRIFFQKLCQNFFLLHQISCSILWQETQICPCKLAIPITKH